MSRPDLKLAMILAKEKNHKRILDIIQQIYFHGLMDGAGGNIVDPDERFIVIKKSTHWDCQCPTCGQWLELDMMGLLNKGEKDAKKKESSEEGSERKNNRNGSNANK